MKLVKRILRVCVLLVAGVLFMGCSDTGRESAEASGNEENPILVGGLVDMTGPTSSVGVPYSRGLLAGVRYINENGGIGGRPIHFDLQDTAYRVSRGTTLYTAMVKAGAVCVQGYGSAVTEALLHDLARDKVPNISASYAAYLANPTVAPYNFFVAADYTTQARAAIRYFKDNWTRTRAPRIAFIYPDHPYGLAPIRGAREYAAELGYTIVGKAVVSLKAKDAIAELLPIKDEKPDFCWIGGTTPSAAAILKSARAIGMKTAFFVNIWGADENLPALAGKAAEGVYCNQAAVAYGEHAPGMQAIRALTGGQPQMTHFIRGFVSILVMAEGLKRADAWGDVSGEKLRQALETLRDYDPMGLAPPISYFQADHRPTMAVLIYRITNGKMTLVHEQRLERRADWLGL